MDSYFSRIIPDSVSNLFQIFFSNTHNMIIINGNASNQRITK